MQRTQVFSFVLAGLLIAVPAFAEEDEDTANAPWSQEDAAVQQDSDDDGDSYADQATSQDMEVSSAADTDAAADSDQNSTGADDVGADVANQALGQVENALQGTSQAVSRDQQMADQSWAAYKHSAAAQDWPRAQTAWQQAWGYHDRMRAEQSQIRKLTALRMRMLNDRRYRSHDHTKQAALDQGNHSWDQERRRQQHAREHMRTTQQPDMRSASSGDFHRPMGQGRPSYGAGFHPGRRAVASLARAALAAIAGDR